jgi:hypothetical protein
VKEILSPWKPRYKRQSFVRVSHNRKYVFNVCSRKPRAFTSPRHRKQFRRVQAAAVVAEVGDLVAAAEAGGDDQIIAAVPRTAGKSTRSPQAWLTS